MRRERKRDFSSHSRRQGNDEPSTKIVIVCEGEETERLYFEKFKERRDGIKIEFPNADKYTDPVNLVQFAKLWYRKYDINVERGDSVWVLFDAEIPRDHNQRDQQIDQAIRLAGENIRIALSNPSFEIWYLLHFGYTNAYLTNEQLLDRLITKQGMSDYSKSRSVFETLQPLQEQAVKNARRLNDYHTTLRRNLNRCECNPSTQVFQLVEHIQELKRANAAR